MNQNPLPRGLLQIVDRIAHRNDVVLELAKTAAAIETKDATDLAGDVIVVHLFGVRRAADAVVLDFVLVPALVERELLKWLDYVAIGAAPIAVWRLDEVPDLTTFCLEHSLPVTSF